MFSGKTPLQKAVNQSLLLRQENKWSGLSEDALYHKNKWREERGLPQIIRGVTHMQSSLPPPSQTSPPPPVPLISTLSVDNKDVILDRLTDYYSGYTGDMIIYWKAECISISESGYKFLTVDREYSIARVSDKSYDTLDSLKDIEYTVPLSAGEMKDSDNIIQAELTVMGKQRSHTNIIYFKPPETAEGIVEINSEILESNRFMLNPRNLELHKTYYFVNILIQTVLDTIISQGRGGNIRKSKMRSHRKRKYRKSTKKRNKKIRKRY
jgi:hypothetical protein